MEGGLKVRNEGAIKRCEICHQSDCLDQQTGQCTRCSEVIVPVELLTARLEEEKPSGLIIPFGRTPFTQTLAALLALFFSTSFVGPYGTLFFAGIGCFWIGLRRVIADAEITGKPSIDLALNLVFMSAGLGGCCFGGLYFLRLVGIIK